MDEGLTDIDFSDSVGYSGSSLADMNFASGDDSYWGDFWGGMQKVLSSDMTKNLLNFGSGLYGLYEADKMKDMAKDAYKASDPFGKYRSVYGDQLLALMADPSSITKRPGYQFQFDQGAEAVQRKLASKGYGGSGNMGVALTEYGQNFASSYFDKEATRLATLAGANISPNFSSSLGGYASGIDTASAALASLGYASVYAGGASQGTPGASPPRPNPAGGEAAKVGTGLELVGRGIGSFEGLGATGGAINNTGGLISGVSKGGVAGYGSALAAGANLASLAGYGGTAATAAGTLGNAAAGNYAGAVKGAGTLYGASTGASSAAVASGATSTAAGASASSLLNNAAAIYTGFKSLTTKEGKFAGTANTALAGYQLGGWPGAIIGAVVGYAQEGGLKDAPPYDAAGFSGTTMDKAWQDQNLARLASNPVGSIASKVGIRSDSITGKLLDPSGWFSKHGDEKRNMKAFLGENQVTDAGSGNYALPDGKVISKQQLQSLAGTWYGAKFAPDGNQEDWQKRLVQELATLYQEGP